MILINWTNSAFFKHQTSSLRFRADMRITCFMLIDGLVHSINELINFMMCL